MGLFNKLFGAKKKQQKSDHLKNQSPPMRVKPDFPLGRNHIDDSDIRTFKDLGKWYPLPDGFIYERDQDGSPLILRMRDKRTFTFLIEASMLTFNEKITRPDGKVVYDTTEVFKIGR